MAVQYKIKCPNWHTIRILLPSNVKHVDEKFVSAERLESRQRANESKRQRDDVMRLYSNGITSTWLGGGVCARAFRYIQACMH